MEQQYFSTDEIAQMLGVTPAYLRKLRQLRTGPEYYKFGRLVRYQMADVSEWISEECKQNVPARLF